MQVKSILLAIVMLMLLDNANAQLYVISPHIIKEKFDNGFIKVKISNFGAIQKNSAQLGRVIHTEENKLACHSFNWDQFNISKDEKEKNKDHYFILAHRGGCSFTSKMMHA